MNAITEDRWNEIYDDLFNKLWEYCPRNNISQEEAKNIMEEVKEIIVTKKLQQ